MLNHRYMDQLWIANRDDDESMPEKAPPPGLEELDKPSPSTVPQR